MSVKIIRKIICDKCKKGAKIGNEKFWIERQKIKKEKNWTSSGEFDFCGRCSKYLEIMPDCNYRDHAMGSLDHCEILKTNCRHNVCPRTK